MSAEPVKVRIYNTGVGRCKKVATAMARGTGFKVVPPAPLRDGAWFGYGALRGMLPTLRQAQAEGRDWYYADNPYFGGRDSGYFRITKGALQHDGSGDFAPDRWRKLGLKIKPWRTTGEYIIVAPPDPIFGELWGMDPIGWLSDTVMALKAATDRPIQIRRKILSQVEPGSPPLAEHLKGAWAVVTYASNIAVDALIAGVPVFCSAPCGGYRMGTPDLSRIEAPVMPDDREQWAWALAANQWSLAEMSSGLCWRELRTR